MVEESDRPGGERPGAEGGSRRIEGDLLAERRALRAAESGEAALVRRAEAAEATVHTLERHVTSLQQRLGEAEAERGRMAELVEAERTVGLEREGELRRVKQREYAEQQLRVEAEERLVGSERESRAELDDLRARLEDSERQADELGVRLEDLQRQLAEAEQSAAAERAAARRAGGELQARVGELELRTTSVERGLEAERGAREGSERVLEAIRNGHGRMEEVVHDLRGAVGRLGGALAAQRRDPAPAPALASAAPAAPVEPQPEQPPSGPRAPLPPALAPPAPAATGSAGGQPSPAPPRGDEMAEALAAAVERLRARAEAAPAPLQPVATPEPAAGAQPAEPAATAPVSQRSHKHSMSLIGRVRFRRKQRRGR